MRGEAVIRMGRKQREQRFFSHGFNVRQRALLAGCRSFFSPSPRKTKHTASTQADRTATTVVPKKTGINRNSDVEAIFQVKDIIGNVIGQI